MYFHQSYFLKKNIHDNFNSADILKYFTEKLKHRGFSVVNSNNRIDFDLKPKFTGHTGKNKSEAFRLLRHGIIEVNETIDSIKILCKFDITYLLVMSTLFGCAMSGLKLMNPESSILSVSELFFVTLGLIFGIGLIFLWVTIWNLIRI